MHRHLRYEVDVQQVLRESAGVISPLGVGTLRGKDYKPRSKKVCYKCGKPGHFIAKGPLSSDSDRGDDKKGKRREKKRYYKKKGGDAHVCREWDSDESSSDSSSDKDATNIAVTKGLLFMAKD